MRKGYATQENPGKGKKPQEKRLRPEGLSYSLFAGVNGAKRNPRPTQENSGKGKKLQEKRPQA
jgi:hypothetical protein